jgi:hypothetical protein
VWARIVVGDHGVQVQPLGLLARHRRADDARCVAHDEGHLVRRAVHGGDNQVAFVLAAAVIGDDNDFTGFNGADASTTRV